MEEMPSSSLNSSQASLVLDFPLQTLPGLAFSVTQPGFKSPESHECRGNCLLHWKAAPDPSGPSTPIPGLEDEVDTVLSWAHSALTPTPRRMPSVSTGPPPLILISWES